MLTVEQIRDLWPATRPIDAAHACWRFGLAGGIEPGGFTAALLAAMCEADPSNLKVLQRAFKGLGTAVYLIKNTDQGADLMVALALTMRDPATAAGQNQPLHIVPGQSDTADKSPIPLDQLSVFPTPEAMSRALDPNPDRPERQNRPDWHTLLFGEGS